MNLAKIAHGVLRAAELVPGAGSLASAADQALDTFGRKSGTRSPLPPPGAAQMASMGLGFDFPDIGGAIGSVGTVIQQLGQGINQVTGGAVTQLGQVTAPVTYVKRPKAPKGYVIVNRGTAESPNYIAVLKKVAVALGLVHSHRRGGGLTGAQIRAARHVNKVIGELTVGRKPKGHLRPHRKHK